jgi:hypothetical protein
MTAETSAVPNEEASTDGDTEHTSPASSDGKLEDAVRRSMRDLEQERRHHADSSARRGRFS